VERSTKLQFSAIAGMEESGRGELGDTTAFESVEPRFGHVLIGGQK